MNRTPNFVDHLQPNKLLMGHRSSENNSKLKALLLLFIKRVISLADRAELQVSEKRRIVVHSWWYVHGKQLSVNFIVCNTLILEATLSLSLLQFPRRPTQVE